jgi:hypothetical protein
MYLRKTQSHGKTGEAAVTAKCWMHGIPAYNTSGLRANFAGSDLIVDTSDAWMSISRALVDAFWKAIAGTTTDFVLPNALLRLAMAIFLHR